MYGWMVRVCRAACHSSRMAVHLLAYCSQWLTMPVQLLNILTHEEYCLWQINVEVRLITDLKHKHVNTYGML